MNDTLPPKRKKPVRRVYRYRAYLDPSQEPEARAAAMKVMDIYLHSCQTPDVQEARKSVNQDLRYLWTPTRQMVGSWTKGVYRRKSYKTGGEQEKPRFRKRPWRSGILGGFFLTTPKEIPWEEILERDEKYRAQVKIIEEGPHPVAEMVMPLYSDKDKDRLRFRFILHRPIPKEGLLQRCYLICTPRVVNGKILGYTWYFGISVRLPDPDLRVVKRTGILTPYWKLEPNGSLLVASLKIVHQNGKTETRAYHLPPGAIRRGRRAYGLSIAGQDNVVYRKFNRWRADIYRKIAVDIFNRVDFLRVKPIQTGVKVPGTNPRHRRYASLSMLYQFLRYRAGRIGAALEIVKPDV